MKDLLTSIRSAGNWLTEILLSVYLGYLQLLCSTFQTTTIQCQKDDPKAFIKAGLLGFKN